MRGIHRAESREPCSRNPGEINGAVSKMPENPVRQHLDERLTSSGCQLDLGGCQRRAATETSNLRINWHLHPGQSGGSKRFWVSRREGGTDSEAERRGDQERRKQLRQPRLACQQLTTALGRERLGRPASKVGLTAADARRALDLMEEPPKRSSHRLSTTSASSSLSSGEGYEIPVKERVYGINVQGASPSQGSINPLSVSSNESQPPFVRMRDSPGTGDFRNFSRQ